jgi:hypothetical protein
MKSLLATALIVALLPIAVPAAAATTTVLYTQDFENPSGFVNDGGDVNIFRTVNQLYGNQPSGFQFFQNFTTETLLVGGTQAWGRGFQDPQGVAGRYVLGLLSDAQNDLLGLSFNVGTFRYLNFQLDISSIDLDRWGGPFVAAGSVPEFRLSLYDNPGGAIGLGAGTLLDQVDITGLAGANDYTFNWSNFTTALDATGNTNGNVTLRIDLLRGGYAAMDNFRIAASDTPGDTGQVPEPGSLSLVTLALLGLAGGLRLSR